MLVMVPIFKSVTHLPPFMGILLGLGILWLVTELMHKGKNDEDKDPLSVMGVLQKVDVPSVLFFFGILVAISSLQATGVLKDLAMFLDDRFGNVYAIGVSLGLLSAIVDNVPLVAASMGMYDLGCLSARPCFMGIHCLLCRNRRECIDYWFCCGSGRNGNGENRLWLVHS